MLEHQWGSEVMRTQTYWCKRQFGFVQLQSRRVQEPFARAHVRPSHLAIAIHDNEKGVPDSPTLSHPSASVSEAANEQIGSRSVCDGEKISPGNRSHSRPPEPQKLPWNAIDGATSEGCKSRSPHLGMNDKVPPYVEALCMEQ